MGRIPQEQLIEGVMVSLTQIFFKIKGKVGVLLFQVTPCIIRTEYLSRFLV